MMLARDRLYVNPSVLVTFLGLHDMLRFMNEPGATLTGLELAQTFLMTIRGTPMVYYGDEIAIPGGGDPDNRRDFPGGFPGDTVNAFERSGRTADQQSVFEHVQRLGAVRSRLEALRRGAQIDLLTAEQQYVYARVTDHQSAVVAINNDGKPVSLEFDVSPARIPEGAVLTDQLGGAGEITVKGHMARVAIGARTGAIFARK